MAKAMLFYNPRPQFLDNTGAVANGGKVFFYEPGTTTKKDTYTDSTKGTANPNPIILDTAGRPDNSGSPIDIWLDGEYKVVLAPSTDTDPPTSALWTVDNVTTLGTLFTYTAKTANYTIVEADRDSVITMDASGAARTVTLLAAATAGSGYILTVKKIDSSSNTVTIDGNAAETIDGATTIVFRQQYDSATLICDGSNWHVIDQKFGGLSENATEFIFRKDGTQTSTVVNPFVITSTTSGTPAAGIGTGIIINSESGDESPSNFGAINFAATDVTAASEDTDFIIQTRVAGAALSDAYKMRVTGVSNYIFTGAPTAERTITFPDADVNLTAATQAEQEAGTETTNRVSSAVQHYHDSALKGWLNYNGVTPAINDSYNVTSVTDNGTGDYTINLTTGFSGNAAIAGAANSVGDAANGIFVELKSASATAPRITTKQGTTLVDRSDVYVCLFGDL